jgi:site-specific DNA-methyltransferase (adenine-specific)
MRCPDPYYSEDGITIYHGDCREILPLIAPADLVITDPPYGIGYRSRAMARIHERMAGDGALPLDLIWLSIHKAEAAAYVFCRWDQLPAMPAPRSVIAWVKNDWTIGDTRHEHGRQWEACCFYPKARHQFVKRIPDVISCDKTANEFHLTQKPVPLLKRIIEANAGESILDPFMGSGSTLLAAKECYRKAVGIEIEERYCEIAAIRLAQAVLPLREARCEQQVLL